MEAQLFQAQKMEAIGTLAGGIAHDFNNLLMVIQGNVSLMLLDVPTSHPHHEMLKMIEKKVLSGSRLTSQLLGYASKGRYEIKPINLNLLLEETAEAFGRTRKNVTIHRDLAQSLSPIEADHGQIEQVLMNLLVNSCDAMPLGGDSFLKTSNISESPYSGKDLSTQAWELRVTDRHRHRDWHGRKDSGADFRPLFHDERIRKRHGSWIGSGLWDS